MKKLSINFYGTVLLFGLIIHIVSQSCWKLIANVKLGTSIYFIGVTIGCISYLLNAREYFRGKKFFFFLVADLGVNVAFCKLFTQLFLKPLNYQPSEYINLSIAIIILVYRVKKNVSKQ